MKYGFYVILFKLMQIIERLIYEVTGGIYALYFILSVYER